MRSVRAFPAIIFFVGLFLISSRTVSAGEGDFANLSNGTCLDHNNGLMWQVAPSVNIFDTAEGAMKYVNSLNLGGHQDWRIPTEEELKGLMVVLINQGNIGCKFLHITKDFWLVVSESNTKAAKMVLECFCRDDFKVIKQGEGYVRAVRSVKKER